MTTPKSDPPSPSPVTTPSSNHRDTLQSLHLRQVTEANHHPSPHPSTTHFTILDLNSNPIRPNSPHPVLRRTASGRLFQPSNRVIHAVEMMDRVITEEEENVELAKWARGEDFRTELRRGNAKGKRVMIRNGRVAGEVRRVEAISLGSLPLTPLGLNVEFGEETGEYEFGKTGHKCASEGSVEPGRLDRGVVSSTQGVGSPEHLLEGPNDVEDVWMDLASSEGAATDFEDVWMDLAKE